MAAVADGIDLLLHGFAGGCSRGSSVDHTRISTAVFSCYVLFAVGWLVVWGKFSDRDFSAILTCASYVQFLAFVLLSIKVHGTKSVIGLSSKSLVMYTLCIAARLTSTSLKSGYIPVDSTGDFMYQLCDFGSLVMALQLLHSIHKTYVHSYQEEYDTILLLPLVLPCVVLGIFCHGSFNGHVFFDSIWAISMNLEYVVMVPQLWMLAKMGGKVDGLTAHYVAVTVASNVMTFTWWWWCGSELAKRGPARITDVIVAGQLFKLLLSADFMYYYAVAWIGGTNVVLPNSSTEY